MKRLAMFLAMTIGGYVGWWAGDYFGFDLMGTFLISSLGSIVGIYLTWRLVAAFLE